MLKSTQEAKNISSDISAFFIIMKLECFGQFYETLYSSSPSQTVIEQFLEALDIPQISKENRRLFDSPIQENEVLQAIENLKNDKAPRLDGFTAKFYKKIKKVLAPQLCKLLNAFVKVKHIPPS